MNSLTKTILSFAMLLCSYTTTTDAFVTIPPPKTAFLPTSTSINMLDISSPLGIFDLPSTIVSTIDSDIANISDDRFGLVFAGGIAVMFGGVASAMIVGAILKYRNSYGRVMADSYMSDDDDAEAFLAGLSDEEREKAEELLAGMRKRKEMSASGGERKKIKEEENVTEEEKEKVAKFGDYD